MAGSASGSVTGDGWQPPGGPAYNLPPPEVFGHITIGSDFVPGDPMALRDHILSQRGVDASRKGNLADRGTRGYGAVDAGGQDAPAARADVNGTLSLTKHPKVQWVIRYGHQSWGEDGAALSHEDVVGLIDTGEIPVQASIRPRYRRQGVDYPVTVGVWKAAHDRAPAVSPSPGPAVIDHSASEDASSPGGGLAGCLGTVLVVLGLLWLLSSCLGGGTDAEKRDSPTMRQDPPSTSATECESRGGRIVLDGGVDANGDATWVCSA